MAICTIREKKGHIITLRGPEKMKNSRKILEKSSKNPRKILEKINCLYKFSRFFASIQFRNTEKRFLFKVSSYIERNGFDFAALPDVRSKRSGWEKLCRLNSNGVRLLRASTMCEKAGRSVGSRRQQWVMIFCIGAGISAVRCSNKGSKSPLSSSCRWASLESPRKGFTSVNIS